MIAAGLHAHNLILDKQWADLKPMLEQTIYPVKGIKYGVSYPYYVNQPDDYKALYKNINTLRPAYSKITVELQCCGTDGEFVSTLDMAKKTVDIVNSFCDRLPSAYIWNEPYNLKDKNGNKLSQERATVILRLYDLALLHKRIDRKIYISPNGNWSGWNELKTIRGAVFPKCIHYYRHPYEWADYGVQVEAGRAMRSTTDCICDEAGLSPAKTSFYDVKWWDEPCYSILRGVIADAAMVAGDFCWWSLFFNQATDGSSVGIMSNNTKTNNPRLHPVLRYFLKPPMGIGNG